MLVGETAIRIWGQMLAEETMPNGECLAKTVNCYQGFPPGNPWSAAF